MTVRRGTIASGGARLVVWGATGGRIPAAIVAPSMIRAPPPCSGISAPSFGMAATISRDTVVGQQDMMPAKSPRRLSGGDAREPPALRVILAPISMGHL